MCYKTFSKKERGDKVWKKKNITITTGDMIDIENEIDDMDSIFDVSVHEVKDKQEIENLKHLKEFVETLETKNELQKEMEKGKGEKRP